MKRFYLQRKMDVSHVSGTGRVADGIQLSSGKVVLEWIVGEHRSMEIWPCLDDCIAVHGHGDLTTVEWLDMSTSAVVDSV